MGKWLVLERRAASLKWRVRGLLAAGRLATCRFELTDPTQMRVLEAVAESSDTRVTVSATLRRTTGRNRMNPGQKGFAMRLKAATRPMANAAR